MFADFRRDIPQLINPSQLAEESKPFIAETPQTKTLIESPKALLTLTLLESYIKVEPTPVETISIIELAKSRLLAKPTVAYSTLTIRELKAIAKQRKVKNYGNMRKAELVIALE